MKIKQLYTTIWSGFCDEERVHELKDDQCGAWKYEFKASFSGYVFAKKICEKAVRDGVAVEVKYLNWDAVKCWKCCICYFYCNCDDMDAHKKIISFFLENKMVKRDGYGNIRNMPFRYEKKRKKRSVPLQFGDFVNLKTGELK